MADNPKQSTYRKIQRDLVRTAIKQPLLSMILDKKKKTDRLIPVIVEANDDYFAGKDEAVKEVQRLVKEVAQVDLPSIGSDANPYYKTSLTPQQILKIVDLDDDMASQKRDAAMEEEKKQRLETPTLAAATPPKSIARYLVILRIWYNHPINPLIDKSASTVKADAAQRAFLADGKDIVWAVIDSGIDGKHDHFAKKTLDVTLPVQHCDFTVTGDDSGALVDKFGHGTHVAGIIAGSCVSSDTQKINAQRTKLGEGETVETFEETLSQIAGMAPSCKLVSLKVLNDDGNGDVSNIIAAIDRIQVINDFGRSVRIHGVNLKRRV